MLIAKYSIEGLPRSPNLNMRGINVQGFMQREANRKARATMREAINRESRPSLYPLPGPFRLVAIFYMPDRRHRDLRQLCTQLKPYEDELIDAGIIQGDSWRYIPIQISRAIYRPKEPGFEIQIFDLLPMEEYVAYGS